ncbi:MAG: serine/threonine-protein phosphatase [Acidimicrobiales bacterium]|nr:serine/threonine-protein phosphatase [Acidimicrobiales bacterium]
MAAIGLMVLLAAGYPLLATDAEHPLAIFLLPLLAAAAVLSWRRTAIIGVLCFVVAAVEGWFLSDLALGAYVARLVIIGTGCLLGTLIAAQRTRREDQLEQAQVRAALSDAFQSSLVPRPVPPSFVQVSSRFTPGDERLQLGGDFFDALELRDGSLGYIMGDVCGHGPRAAALGAAIRAGWKTIANREPSDPVVWIGALEDAFFRYGRHDEYVTINTGRIGVGEASLRYVSAGHPWPIVLDASGAQFDRPRVGPPLGITVRPVWEISKIELTPGMTLLLYTDGLIENDVVGRSALEGEAALLRYLRDTDGLDLDALLQHFGPSGYNDDVAVLAVSLPPRPDAPEVQHARSAAPGATDPKVSAMGGRTRRT